MDYRKEGDFCNGYGIHGHNDHTDMTRTENEAKIKRKGAILCDFSSLLQEMSCQVTHSGLASMLIGTGGDIVLDDHFGFSVDYSGR